MARPTPPPPPGRRRGPPAPPTRRRTPPPPPPPPRSARTPEKAAGAHVRRVTLNLIHRAACCPPDLRETLDRLVESGWDMGQLGADDAEVIFSEVTDDLAQRAAGEYFADTSTIVDHRSLGYVCGLCGHQHCRWEFRLRNDAGGRDHDTGSTCIETYGLRVDGEETAEAALERLKRAIAAAKEQAEREDWQAQWPGAASDIELLRQRTERVKRPGSRALTNGSAALRVASIAFRNVKPSPYSKPGPEWQAARKAYNDIVGALRRFDDKAFLTDTRTLHVFGPWPRKVAPPGLDREHGLAAWLNDLDADIDAALARAEANAVEWAALKARYDALPLYSGHPRRDYSLWSRLQAHGRNGEPYGDDATPQVARDRDRALTDVTTHEKNNAARRDGASTEETPR